MRDNEASHCRLVHHHNEKKRDDVNEAKTTEEEKETKLYTTTRPCRYLSLLFIMEKETLQGGLV